MPIDIEPIKIELIPIDQVIPYENNPRQNSKAVDEVAKSIEKYGFNMPIVVDKDGIIVAGHTRLKAARQLGMVSVPVYRKSFTEEQARAYRLADNKSAEYSEWDMGALRDELQHLKESGFEMEFTCFAEEEINTILSSIDATNGGLTDEDSIPEASAEQITQPGDLWVLDNHRVLCGDATNIDDISRLIDGNTIDMVFTDPPYNVNHNSRGDPNDKIQGDNLNANDFDSFLDELRNTIQIINPAILYIWCNWKFYGALQSRFNFRACIVWAKNNFGFSSGYGVAASGFRHQHEFCLFNGKIDEEIHNESDLWEIARDVKYLHPTQKPVELAERAFKNHKKAINILDLFGGSGSTLIAAEKNGKRCFTTEIDPIYCDVIIQRWQQYTGKKAILLDKQSHQ